MNRARFVGILFSLAAAAVLALPGGRSSRRMRRPSRRRSTDCTSCWTRTPVASCGFPIRAAGRFWRLRPRPPESSTCAGRGKAGRHGDPCRAALQGGEDRQDRRRTDRPLGAAWRLLGRRSDCRDRDVPGSPDGRSTILSCSIDNRSGKPVTRVLFPDLVGLTPIQGAAPTEVRTGGCVTRPFADLRPSPPEPLEGNPGVVALDRRQRPVQRDDRPLDRLRQPPRRAEPVCPPVGRATDDGHAAAPLGNQQEAPHGVSPGRDDRPRRAVEQRRVLAHAPRGRLGQGNRALPGLGPAKHQAGSCRCRSTSAAGRVSAPSGFPATIPTTRRTPTSPSPTCPGWPRKPRSTGWTRWLCGGPPRASSCRCRRFGNTSAAMRGSSAPWPSASGSA